MVIFKSETGGYVEVIYSKIKQSLSHHTSQEHKKIVQTAHKEIKQHCAHFKIRTHKNSKPQTLEKKNNFITVNHDHGF